MVTLAYNGGKLSEGPVIDEIDSAARSLLDDVGTAGETTAIIDNLIGIFVALCHTVKGTYPDADIEGFLQYYGLLASGESGD